MGRDLPKACAIRGRGRPCARPECARIHGNRAYCSRSCASRHRIAQGWQPHAHLLDPVLKQRACHKAGVVTGARRRHARAARIAAQLHDVMVKAMKLELPQRETAALKALLVKAYRIGKLDTLRSDWYRAKKASAA
jgi:hypothetical protein